MGFADDLGGALGAGWIWKDTNPGDYVEGIIETAAVARGSKYKSEEEEKKLVVQIDPTGGTSGGVDVERGAPCRVLVAGGRAGAVGRALDKAMKATGRTDPDGLAISITFTNYARSATGTQKKCWTVKVAEHVDGGLNVLATEIMK